MQSSPTSVTEKVHDRSAIDTDSGHGVFGSWWQLVIGMCEASSTFGFGLAQDTRAEVRRRADVILNFAEEMEVGGFAFARKLVGRVDRLSHEMLGRSEASVLVVTRTLRKTGHGVADLASTAASETIGSSHRASTPRPAAA